MAAKRDPDRPKRQLTRKQAEGLAKNNPSVAARLAAGEFDRPAGSGTGTGRAGTGRKPARKPVTAAAPPAAPRRRASSSSATRAPRPTRDNGDPPKKPGLFRSIFDGFFDI